MALKQSFRASLIVVGLSAPALLLANSETTQFQVSTTVENACQISVSDLNFGTYNILSGEPLESTTSLAVTCTTGAAYNLALNGGSAGDTSARAMSDGNGGSLSYSLYQDDARTQAWGDAVDVDTLADTGSGTEQTHTIYGRVPSGQNVSAGEYNDTVTATVHY